MHRNRRVIPACHRQRRLIELIDRIGRQRQHFINCRRRDKMVHHRQAILKDRLVARTDHASPENDLRLRMGALDTLHVAQFAQNALLGGRAHAARVEHNETRLLRALGRGVPDPLQRRFQAFGVGHVHLAADRPDIVAALTRRRVARVRRGRFLWRMQCDRIGHRLLADLALARSMRFDGLLSTSCHYSENSRQGQEWSLPKALPCPSLGRRLPPEIIRKRTR